MSLLTSLEHEHAALLALSARLQGLTDRTRWPTDVKLGNRASVPGEIVHTNDVKVHLGAGFWADLTARQAAAFVDRKRGVAEAKLQALRLQAVEQPVGLQSLRSDRSSVGRLTPLGVAPIATSSSASTTTPSLQPATTLSTSSEQSARSLDQPTTVSGSDSALVSDSVTAVSPERTRSAPPPAAAVSPPVLSPALGISSKRAASETAELVPLLLPSGAPQLAPEDSLPLFELRLAVDGLLADEVGLVGGKGKIEPLPPVVKSGEEIERRRKERERIWAEAEDEERRLEGAVSNTPTDTERLTSVGQASEPTDPAGDSLSKVALSSASSASADATSDDPGLLSIQSALDALAPADGVEGDVASNALEELVDEGGRPISRIAIPVPPSSINQEIKAQGPEPLPPQKALSATQAAKRKAERERLLDMLEAEEAEGGSTMPATATAGVVREVRRLPDLSASPAASDDDEGNQADGTTPKTRPTKPERRKSVQWAEADQVKEFDLREPVVMGLDAAGSSVSLSSSAASSSAPSNTLVSKDKISDKDEKGPRGPIVKDQVVERPAQAVMPLGARSTKPQSAISDAKGKDRASATGHTSAIAASTPDPHKTRQPLVKEVAERPTPTKPPAPPISEETSVLDTEDNEDDPTADLTAYEDDDDDEEGSYELSDVDSDHNDFDGGDGPVDLGLDMDEKLLMREAAVSYYRLKGALNSRGGLEALLRGMGEAGGGDEPEFVPLNATLASDLDEVRLAPAEQTLSDSRFYNEAHAATPSSIALPTLVPGGSATGVLRNAIRVGRLENGQLVVGGDESDDGQDDADVEDEIEQAGKEALMWGMVGGVVVRPEDLAEQPAEDKDGKSLSVQEVQQSLSTPPPPPELPQEALPPPRGQASNAPVSSAKASARRIAPKVMTTRPEPTVSTVSLAPPRAPAPQTAAGDSSVPAAASKSGSTSQLPKSILKPTPLPSAPPTSPAPTGLAAEPMQLVGTPFERVTPSAPNPLSTPGASHKLDDPPAAPTGGKKMSKFRMRQLGLAYDD